MPLQSVVLSTVAEASRPWARGYNCSSTLHRRSSQPQASMSSSSGTPRMYRTLLHLHTVRQADDGHANDTWPRQHGCWGAHWSHKTPEGAVMAWLE